MTVTTKGPDDAPAGTTATMFVLLQLVTAAPVALSATVLAPCVAPKFVPVIVTRLPTIPDNGERLAILGPGGTVNATGLLAPPPTVTITLPVVAPVGTGTVIVVEVQLVGVAVVPAKVTVLVPCVEPKLVPVIVTSVPGPPEVGFRFAMLGVDSTVKLTPLLTTPPTMTTTSPFVAAAGTGTTMLASFQLAGLAVTPLNVTVLPPCVGWKPAPWIVTAAPIGAAAGDKNSIVGALLGVACASMV